MRSRRHVDANPSGVVPEESLGVFWDGEEVDGVLAYGFWWGAIAREPEFPRDLWPAGTEARPWRFYGEGWIVLLWTIRITEWPAADAWEMTLRRTLDRLIEAGACVAWCGLEGRFSEPPGLFNPAEMPDSVYAATATGIGFMCTAHLGRPFETFGESDLERLRQVVAASHG